MSEDLKVFGKTYSGVTGIQVKDTSEKDINYFHHNKGSRVYQNTDGYLIFDNFEDGALSKRKYLIKNGRVEEGIVLNAISPTTATEETTNGIDYVFMSVSGNNYGSVQITNTDFDFNQYQYLKLELVSIDGVCGWSWVDSNFPSISIGSGEGSSSLNYTSNIAKTRFGVSSSGYIYQTDTLCGIPAISANSSHIRVNFSADSTHNGFLYVKNLYFMEV